MVVDASGELLEDGVVQIVAALSAAAEGWLDEAWNALARAEAAIHPADDELIGETEEALEAGEERARELLLTTRLSVQDIAETVGYTDPYYFSRQFRRVNGVSPRAFRDGHLEEVMQRAQRDSLEPLRFPSAPP